MTRPAFRLAVSLAMALAIGACGSSVPSVSPAASVGASTNPAPSSSTEASEPAGLPSAEATPVASAGGEEGQTDTEWGRIWDSPPAGFPKYPGGNAVRGGRDGPGERRLCRRRRRAGPSRPGSRTRSRPRLQHRGVVGAARGRGLRPGFVRPGPGVPAVGGDRAAWRNDDLERHVRGTLPARTAAGPRRVTVRRGNTGTVRRDNAPRRRMLALGSPRGRSGAWGRRHVQRARPQDLGALVLVVGLFLILFVVTLALGSPVR